jgi:hypothetical protein
MPKKPAAKPAVAPTPKPTPKPAPKPAPVPAQKKGKKDEEPKLLALSTDERLRLRLYESETVRWASEAHLRQSKRMSYLQKIDPQNLLGKMDEEIRAVASKSQASKKQYTDLVAAVEARLNIKLADYSFDDETGALMPH